MPRKNETGRINPKGRIESGRSGTGHLKEDPNQATSADLQHSYRPDRLDIEGQIETARRFLEEVNMFLRKAHQDVSGNNRSVLLLKAYSSLVKAVQIVPDGIEFQITFRKVRGLGGIGQRADGLYCLFVRYEGEKQTICIRDRHSFAPDKGRPIYPTPQSAGKRTHLGMIDSITIP